MRGRALTAGAEHTNAHQLEQAQTHDELWNAAQKEMVLELLFLSPLPLLPLPLLPLPLLPLPLS